MVIIHSLQDIKDSLRTTENFTLPALKLNPLRIDFNKDGKIETTYCGSEPPWPFLNSEVCYSKIVDWRRLTAARGDCKAVYEVTFDVAGSKFDFRAGDSIGVIPHNDESDVNFIISHLNLASTADLPYSLYLDTRVKGSKIPVHVPVKSSLRHVLTYCLDVRSVLKKLFLLALSKYTKDEKDRKTLEYLCSKEGSSAYTTHILNKNQCLLDIFTIFKTCTPTVEVLFAYLPRLLPRPYSTVNSGLKNNKVIKICFSVVTNNDRKGLATGWLETLILNDDLNLENKMRTLSIKNEFQQQKVPIYIRKNLSMFSLPENLESPLILIGPGTGVSPFIGFLEEREYLKASNNVVLGEVWLFFGCRNSKLDFIYEKELNGFLSGGILNKLCLAFSREDNYRIKYIQHSLLENGNEITKLIKDGASVYICGDLNTMVADIKKTLIKCFVEHDGITVEEAENKLSEMQKDKKYCVDAWS